MATVKCVALDGSAKLVDEDRLIVRPAAYAIIVSDRQLLLVRLRPTMKYHLPGGDIEPGETPEEDLRREVREETGIEIEVGPRTHYEEFCFYYDPSDRAYRGQHSYYLCRPLSTTLQREDQVEDGSAEEPGWVPLDALSPEDFQIGGQAILALARRASGEMPLAGGLRAPASLTE
jgi:8-oxo-dGTP pyrophosphatase MutT (NUDIX family)